jgi:hypothetical protein
MKLLGQTQDCSGTFTFPVDNEMLMTVNFSYKLHLEKSSPEQLTKRVHHEDEDATEIAQPVAVSITI